MLSSKLTPTDCFCLVREKTRKTYIPHPFQDIHLVMWFYITPLLFLRTSKLKRIVFETSPVRRKWRVNMRWCECSRGWGQLVWTRHAGPKCGLCVNALTVWFHYESQILYKARKEPFAVTYPEPWADSHLLPIIKLTQPQKPCAGTQSPAAARGRE